jgi:hypothetical protein
MPMRSTKAVNVGVATQPLINNNDFTWKWKTLICTVHYSTVSRQRTEALSYDHNVVTHQWRAFDA